MERDVQTAGRVLHVGMKALPGKVEGFVLNRPFFCLGGSRGLNMKFWEYMEVTRDYDCIFRLYNMDQNNPSVFGILVYPFMFKYDPDN